MYNFDMTLRELLDDPKSKAVLVEYLGEELLFSSMADAALDMSIHNIRPFTEGMVPAEVFDQVLEALKKL